MSYHPSLVFTQFILGNEALSVWYLTLKQRKSLKFVAHYAITLAGGLL